MLNLLKLTTLLVAIGVTTASHVFAKTGHAHEYKGRMEKQQSGATSDSSENWDQPSVDVYVNVRVNGESRKFTNPEKEKNEREDKQSKHRPNIVIIMADDLGFNDLSYHGSTQIPTPNVDQLSKDGLIFTRFYGQAICTPSRVAIMSGKYPFNLGGQAVINDGEPRGLPLNRKILPQYLKELGYSTHLIGKWHLGQHKSSFFPNNRGFDTFLGNPGGQIDYYDGTDLGGYTLFNNTSPLRLNTTKYITNLYADFAEDVIEGKCPGRTPKKPFFLFFSPSAPHTASADSIDLTLQTAPEYYNLSAVQNITDEPRRKYAAMVVGLDVAVGRIRQFLIDNKLDRNTIVWFLSDNGGPILNDVTALTFSPSYAPAPANNWPFRGGKNTLWEGGVHVPSIIWGHKNLIDSSKRRSNQLFHFTDFLPTLVSMAGGDPKEILDIDGFDQWESIRSGSHRSVRTLLPIDIDYVKNRRALIWENYKIITGPASVSSWYRPRGTDSTNPMRETRPTSVNCNFPEGVEQTPCVVASNVCLFNLLDDPCETNNIAASKPYVLAKMLEDLRVFNQTYITPASYPVDPLSAPSLHGGVWVPWLD